ALFSGNPGGSMGYRNGFRLVATGPRSRKARFAEAPISDANKLAPLITSWLTEARSLPFFAYIHFREPHGPYKPPRQFLRRFVQDGMTYQERVAAHYDGNLAFVDSQVGLIFRHLRKLNLWDRTIIIVMADHGEAFWQHGERGHIRQVYDEMIRIPMIFRFPNEGAFRGIRKSALVGTVDIMPTLIDLFSFTRKNVYFLNGQSLLQAFGSAQPQRLLLSVCAGNKPAYSLRSKEFKYIEYEDSKFPQELYHLETDPRETANVTNQFPVMAGFYRAELHRKLTDLRQLAAGIKGWKRPTLTLDEQTREELRALGYVY
ncbi:MAG TPA: sulfatase-like hydrolase/transferase, partial [Acidobacteriota bacterium]